MGVFFVNTRDGRVATGGQLAEAGMVDELGKPERGVFIGTLCIRHTERKHLLAEQGWEEVPIPEIGVAPQAM